MAGWFHRTLFGAGVAASVVSLACLMSMSPVGAAGTGGAPGLHVTPLRPAVSSSPVMPATPAASPWTPLANQPPFDPDTMLLESDGTVLAQAYSASGGGTRAWYKLTPNAQGSYVKGTWSKIASMPAGYDPLYYGSGILPNGDMIVEGGEYLGTTPTWTNKGAIFNPVTNTWKSVNAPTGWTNIGDAESDVLANGTYMLAQACQTCTTSAILTKDEALFNASKLTWTVLPGAGKHDPNDEEGWSLLPSNQVLTEDTWTPPNTEVFTQSTKHWSSAGNTVTSVVDNPAKEIGPQIVMPGGNTFVVGAGTASTATTSCNDSKRANTALYDYANRSWVAGPKIPTINKQQMDSADGPGSILPDGNVLFDVSPCVYLGGLSFELYKASTNTLAKVADPPTAITDSTFYTRLLALPNGQILFDDGSQNMYVYTAGGTPKATWAPSITSISTMKLAPGATATLSGLQLAGLSQGAAYGDDVQDNTNFPLVRITNTGSGVVTYARTHGWTSVSIAPGTSSSTKFTLPSTTPAGPSSLVVVANGIASAPVSVTVS
jgi:hypothetical protein